MALGTPQSGQASFQMPPQAPKLPSLIKRVSKLLAIVDPKSKAALVAADFAKLESKSLAAAKSVPSSTAATAAFSRRGRNPLAIVDPKSKEAVAVHCSKATSLAAADEPASAQSRRTFGAGCIPRRHALAVVDPDTKQQLTQPGSAAHRTCAGAQISSIAGINGRKEGKKVMTIVEPASQLAVVLPVKGLANSSLLRTSGLNSGSSHPQHSIRRAVTIVDPHSKEPVVPPEVTRPAWHPNTATAIRPVRNGSAGLADSRRAKAIMAIVDPVTSATVQPPEVKPSSYRTNKTVGQVQAWGIARPRKVLAIVSPTGKPGISSTEAANKQAELVAVACV